MTRETPEQEKATEDLSSSIPRTQKEEEEEITSDVFIELSDCLVSYSMKPWLKDRRVDEWVNIFDKAAVFQGDDKMLWGKYLACVYREPKNGKLSCLFVDRLGVMHLNSLDISSRSRFYPAIANLVPEYRTQNVHKCIAVGLLKKYSVLDPEDVKRLNDNMVCDYDQTTAGDLANSCELVGYCTPRELGTALANFGLLQPRFIQSLLLDVVYSSSENTVDANNQIVYYLGEQLEQLFDPLTEYSPEHTETCYKPPEVQADAVCKDEPLVVSICDELLRVQTSFTLSLVEFLQKFLIPLRIAVLRDELPGLSTVRLNRLFPPTIDEVTRINCIFLDSLRSATPHGALEIMRACNITVPYFYKAYARHEAATKHFSKDIKYFMNKFAALIPYPNIYTESKLDTLIRGPQEKLMKLKLIIDRLCQSKTWDSPENHDEAAMAYGSICNVIDSFGRSAPTTGSYSTRVFTPSGKILTELAKGWPSELQYKWLKRRIVGVFDVVLSNDDTQRDILVIFSDYVVFLNVLDGNSYYGDGSAKPLLSDVLMNSLINEVPLPSTIPNLHVRSYCYIDDIHVSIYGKDMLRFDALGHNSKPKSFAYRLASPTVETSYIADLCTKAKILEKNTAFHLFKSSAGSFNMYSIAHELEAYKAEHIKSNFVVFLNLPPSTDLLKQLGVEVGFFTSLVDDSSLEIQQLNINGDMETHTLTLEMFISFMVGKLSSLYKIYFSSSSSPIFERLLQINANLVDMVGDNFCRFDNNSSTEKDNEVGRHIIDTPKSHLTPAKIMPVKSSLGGVKEHFPSGAASVKSGRFGDDEVSVKSDKLLDKHKKGKNIFNKLTKLFRKKKDKKVKIRRTAEKPLTSPVKPPVQNVKKTESKASTGTNENTPKKHRHSSVTHSAIEVQALHERAMRSNLFGFAKKSYSMQDIMANPENDSTNVEATANSEINSDIAQRNSTSMQNNIYSSQNNRLSKIFNDDLFGEIISSKKGTGTEDIHATSSSTVGKVEASKNIGSVTSMDGNASFENPQLTFRYPQTNENEEEPSHLKPVYNHVKIQMDRSPSLVELFGDMRQVLDENDERANWRRLSSDRSLNDRYQIKPNPRMVHLFSQFTDTKEGILKEETKSELNSSSNSSNATTTNAPPRSGTSAATAASAPSPAAFDVPEPILESDKENKSPQHNGQTSMISSMSNKVLDGDTALNRNGKGHGFIVTKATPAKIWNKEDFTSKVSDTRSDITDVSSISSLRKATDRLLEFSINSQEDLGEDNFFTPVVNPEDTFSNSSLRQKSDSTMDLTIEDYTCDDTPIHAENQSQLPSSEYSDLSAARQQSSQQHSAAQPPPEAILDELEFSTFHMSFENSRAESSSVWEGDSNPKTLIADQIVKPRSAPDPLFYKLPESLDEVSTASTAIRRNGTALSESQINDEALWVSPSKLDFYDLSNQPDSVYRKKILPQHQLTLIKTLPRDPSMKFHESTISKDNSYIYLGQFVNATNATEYAEEKSLQDITEGEAKPERLTFSAGN